MLIVASIATTAVFAMLSALVLDSPGLHKFDGYIMLLGNLSDVQEALISVEMLDSGGSANPPVEVSAALCGQGSFSGVLLLGGDAVITDVRSIFPGQDPPHPAVYSGQLMNDSTPLAEIKGVQGFEIAVGDLPPCSSVGLGAVAELTFVAKGRFQAPLAVTSGILGIESPRTSLALPQLGAFASPVPSGMIGRFQLPGDSRHLYRPQNLTLRVSGPKPMANQVIEESDPGTSDAQHLSWLAANTLTARAIVLNRDRQISLLQSNAYLAIGFGIAASILTSFILDWVRMPAPVPVTRSAEMGEVPPPFDRQKAKNAPVTNRKRSRLVTGLVLVFLIGRLWRIRR
jgi:hypothetical protein